MNRVKLLTLQSEAQRDADWNQKHQRLVALGLQHPHEVRLDAAPTVVVDVLSNNEVTVSVFPVGSSRSTVVYRGPAVITQGMDGPLCCMFTAHGWIHFLTF